MWRSGKDSRGNFPVLLPSFYCVAALILVLSWGSPLQQGAWELCSRDMAGKKGFEQEIFRGETGQVFHYLQTWLEPARTAQAEPCSSLCWCPQSKAQELSNSSWKVLSVLAEAACQALLVSLAGPESPQELARRSPAQTQQVMWALCPSQPLRCSPSQDRTSFSQSFLMAVGLAHTGHRSPFTSSDKCYPDLHFFSRSWPPNQGRNLSSKE